MKILKIKGSYLFFSETKNKRWNYNYSIQDRAVQDRTVQYIIGTGKAKLQSF